ncbi:type II secretion system protein GspL [Sphaerotilus mobilis]|uniref:Type II secretion system protein L (GspL) n=1 Tax=Sphaerotilus mobilis TaxID=47994 RepID=A0A4Q7LGD6_9BURK|nr:type II secretion system protein GspL [Sphaerotilus mobilis]RZS53083.1 type II secretion system protein L (GspL) [Sphaerotilus mobilis]
MSVLIVQLPPRARLLAGAAAGAPESTAAADGWLHVLSPDGRAIGAEGRAPSALLPAATSTVLVCASGDVSFHRITVPRAPAARMDGALRGLLEERVLEDIDGLHLALEPGAQPGAEAWVAVMDASALKAAIARLEAAGRPVDRVVPAQVPGNQPATLDIVSLATDGHDTGFDGAASADERGWVSLSHADGLVAWPWNAAAGRPGPLTQALLPDPLPVDLNCSASPALVQASEAWLGRPVAVRTPAQRMLAAAQSGWNLRQHGLAPRHRGATVVRDLLTRLRSPAWRPVRWGLAGLVGVQLIGLNAWAWQQRSELAERKARMTQLLRSAHPQVRAILDAPVQMRRENESLRAAAGKAGDTDLEPMLQAVASAWPDKLPVQTLRYENARLTLAAPQLGDDEVARLRSQLQPAGWRVEGNGSQLTLSRAPQGATR